MTLTCHLSENALDHVRFDEVSKRWNPTGDHIAINLPIKKAGWYSLDGQLQVHSKQHSLMLMTDNGVCIMLPLTRKGLLVDVFYLPANVQRVWLQLEGQKLSVAHCTITVSAIGAVKRLWRMARRVALTYVRQPAAQRRIATLHWYSLCAGLEPCYRKVSQLRQWSAEIPYSRWQELNEHDTPAQHRRARRLLQKQQNIVVVVYGDNSIAQSYWQSSVNSVFVQQWTSASVQVLLPVGIDALDSLPETVQITTADRLKNLPSNTALLLLRAGAILSPRALAWWRIMANSETFSYSDHDYFTTERCLPQFKPDWSLELLRSTHYIGDVVGVSAGLLAKSGWLEADWQQCTAGQHLVLRLAEQLLPAQQPEHISAVLWHDLLAPGGPSPEPVQQHLNRLNIRAEARTARDNTVWVDYALSATPLVSIIIPTRDMLHLLAPCVNSVLEQTQYPAFEIVIVDNQSTCPDTLAYMQQLSTDPRVTILRYDQPFNYAAINNYAVEQAAGELICLLNNDTEVITPQWLGQMVGVQLQSNVGAVGARLLYSNRTVQHAGDAVGPGGCADHMHSGIDEHDAGYMRRAVATQELSAVTAACLLTPKALFQQLNGLNARQLAVAFNDVDYCLRVREAGKRVVYTPHAQLYHHESVSRGKDDTDEKVRRTRAEADYMRQRWAHIMQHDPFYNPNLNYARPDFTLGREQRVKAPWQR